jgi:hypothetical protein
LREIRQLGKQIITTDIPGRFAALSCAMKSMAIRVDTSLTRFQQDDSANGDKPDVNEALRKCEPETQGSKRI